LLLFLLPILDFALLFPLAERIGGMNVLTIAIASALFGWVVVRQTGLRVIDSWQRALAESRAPEEGVADGLLWLAAGLLLIAPGVIGDAAGLLLLVPPLRRVLAGWLRKRVARRFEEARAAGDAVESTTVSGDPASGVRVHVVRVRTVSFGSVRSDRPLDPGRDPVPSPRREPPLGKGRVIDADFEVRDD
jgi:UPF0716 protein FxsA